MIRIDEALNEVKNAIKAYNMKDKEGKYILDEIRCNPIYLESIVGVGKTEGIKQVAEELNIGCVSSSLVHHTRLSVQGLPVISELKDGTKYTEYTMSEILAEVYKQVEQGYDEGILLLDEFPCMSESIMPMMLAFLQTRNIGEVKLPRGWCICLCGNPPKYNKSSRTFDAAITDRIRKIEIKFSAEAFLEYAEKNGFNENVLNYLKLNKEHIYRFARTQVSDKKTEEELVTCRSWQNFAENLDIYEKLGLKVTYSFVNQYIKSEEIARLFYEYYTQIKSGISNEDIEDVIMGKVLVGKINEYKDMKFSDKWNFMELVFKTVKEKCERLDLNIIANYVSNIFSFIEKIDESKMNLAEVFYHTINETPRMLKAVINHNVKEYNDMVEVMFDGEK